LQIVSIFPFTPTWQFLLDPDRKNQPKCLEKSGLLWSQKLYILKIIVILHKSKQLLALKTPT